MAVVFLENFSPQKDLGNPQSFELPKVLLIDFGRDEFYDCGSSRL